MSYDSADRARREGPRGWGLVRCRGDMRANAARRDQNAFQFGNPGVARTPAVSACREHLGHFSEGCLCHCQLMRFAQHEVIVADLARPSSGEVVLWPRIARHLRAHVPTAPRGRSPGI